MAGEVATDLRKTLAAETTAARSDLESGRPTRLDRQRLETLEEAVVVVTGAGRGIGRATARAFAEAGSFVVLGDVDFESVEAAATELRRDGYQAEPAWIEISEPERMRVFFGTLLRRFGRVDVLVNNAGIVHADPLLDISIETWRRVMRVNLDGTFLASQAAARVMRTQEPSNRLQRRGAILNISSFAADVGRPSLAAYGASKAAINHLSKSLAMALHDLDVSTIVLYPSNVKEGMWEHLGASLAKVEGRTVEEIASERDFQSVTVIAEIVRDAAAVPGLELNGALVLPTRDVCAV